MALRRKAPEILDATGLEAVTEFNQWLRGLDDNAIQIWQTAAREARDARGSAERIGTGFLLVILALLGVNSVWWVRSADAAVIGLLAAGGVVIALAGMRLLHSADVRYREAARTTLLLEYKLGFLHQQLEGDHVSPTGHRRSDAEAARKGKYPGLGAWLSVAVLSSGALHAVLFALAVGGF